MLTENYAYDTIGNESKYIRISMKQTTWPLTGKRWTDKILDKQIKMIKLAHLCSVKEIDLLITDSSVDPAAVKALKGKDLEVLVAR